MPETENQSLPYLPCPSCGVNLLETGFYDSCTETQSLREDNYTRIIDDRLYLDHEESDHEHPGSRV